MAKYAMCVGINDYPGTGSDLSGCVNDANDWAQELGRRNFEVAKLLDGEAKKAAIVEGLRATLGRARAGDVVVFTYSGHGTWVPDDDGDEPDHRDEALCPHDVAKGPLLDDELHDLFADRARGVRVVFVSDSCHSGTVAKLAPSPGGEPRKVRFLSPEHYRAFHEERGSSLRELRRLERAPRIGRSRGTALLLSGCRDFEFSYDAAFGGRANGAFTRAALDALKTLAADASYRTWFKAIRKQLPSMAYPQTPGLMATSTQKGWRVLEAGG